VSGVAPPPSADQYGPALRRGEALADLARWEEAARSFSLAAACRPDAAEPHCQLAVCHLGLERAPEALRAAEQAAALAPGWEWPHRLRSIALVKLGRPGPALEAARTAVGLEPLNALPYTTLARAQLAARDHKGARQSAARAVELDATSSEPWRMQALVALNRRDWRTAEESYRQALTLDPTDSTALNNLGVALDEQHRRDEALEFYARAAQADPRFTLAADNARTAARRRVIGVTIGGLFLLNLARDVLDEALTPIIGGGVAEVTALLAMVVALVLLVGRSRRPRQARSALAESLIDHERSRLRQAAVRPWGWSIWDRWARTWWPLLFAGLFTLGSIANLVDPDPAEERSPVLYVIGIVVVGAVTLRLAVARFRHLRS
jgi:tetratricopeptide (TPR) repeat protein